MTGDRTDNREQDREQGIGKRTRNWTEKKGTGQITGNVKENRGWDRDQG